MASTKIGLIARQDNGGLGNQTWETFRHIYPHRTLVIDLEAMNGHKQYPERYTGLVRPHKGFLDKEAMEWITADVDILLTYEIPYGYELFTLARKKGVKTVLVPMWEFLDYHNQVLPQPDVFASPSTWHYDELKNWFPGKTKMLLHPVDRERLPFRSITKINTFVHIAGVKLYEDRNGTELLLEAIPLVQNDVKFIIYTQHELPGIDDPRVEVRGMQDNYWDLYKEGECLVLPRRFGGQSLPLNEAMSVGMIPIMLDIDPVNKILDPLSLVWATGSKKIETRTEIDCYSTEPRLLAAKIDEFADLPVGDVASLNKLSHKYSENLDWKNRIHDYDHLTRITD